MSKKMILLLDLRYFFTLNFVCKYN